MVLVHCTVYLEIPVHCTLYFGASSSLNTEFSEALVHCTLLFERSSSMYSDLWRFWFTILSHLEVLLHCPLLCVCSGFTVLYNFEVLVHCTRVIWKI